MKQLGNWIGRLFSRPPVLDDPVLGPLKGDWDGRMWVRTAPLVLDGNEVRLHVHARRREPDERQRELFSELIARFDGLRAAIGEGLYREYQTLREGYRQNWPGSDAEFEKDLPAVGGADEIWNIAHLWVVELQGFGGVDVALGYEIDWGDPEHCLTVILKDWKVVAVKMEG